MLKCRGPKGEHYGAHARGAIFSLLSIATIEGGRDGRRLHDVPVAAMILSIAAGSQSKLPIKEAGPNDEA